MAIDEFGQIIRRAPRPKQETSEDINESKAVASTEMQEPISSKKIAALRGLGKEDVTVSKNSEEDKIQDNENNVEKEGTTVRPEVLQAIFRNRQNVK